jgi:hypothetical protein
LLQAIHLDQLSPLIPTVCFAMLLVEMCFTLLTKKRRSLHDLLFRTEVVLDAGIINR